MIVRGFYLIKDEFFEIMNDPYLMNNKEGNSPFYYCVIIWLKEKVYRMKKK